MGRCTAVFAQVIVNLCTQMCSMTLLLRQQEGHPVCKNLLHKSHKFTWPNLHKNKAC